MKNIPFAVFDVSKNPVLKQLFRIMQISMFLLFFCLFSLMAENSYSQNARVTLNRSNTQLETILNEIESQTDYIFIYKENINVKVRKSIRVADRPLAEVLTELLAGSSVSYKMEGNHIILVRNAELPALQQGVKGVVTDVSGEPLIGVTVVLKGTTQGTATDVDGKFLLEAKVGDVLVFSYIGYISQEVKIKDDKFLHITMEEDVEQLDEVIVIGYGTQKKSDLSGSVTTVSGDKLSKISTANAGAALQGMVPGLSVNFDNGAPGTAATLSVRGVTTWGTDNAPLVIIDGVPGDLSYLNPEDIKSMSVLKDAATAAIYGARAAAGVILIETYRGEKQTPKIHFSAYAGMDDLPKRMDVCNAEEFIKVRKMALANAGYEPQEWPRYISAYEKDPSQFADTDWQKEYYRRALTHKYSFGYTAGNEIMNLSISGFYSGKDGIVIGTDEKKYGFRINSDVTRGKFKIGESVSYNRQKVTPEVDTGFPGIYQATNIEPLVAVYDENNDGGFGGALPGMDMSDAANPVAFNKLVRLKSAHDYLAASGYLQYEPIKNLILKFNASRNINWGSYREFYPTYEVGVLKRNTKASLYEERNKSTHDLIEFTVNWNGSIDHHHLQFLFGLSQEENKYDDIEASGKKFENNDMDLLEHAQQDFAVNGEYTRSGLRSVFGRASYNYHYRYMLMFSCRYDGSSRFADGKKWGFFPSASMAWNLSNETFWTNMKEKISTFKLRMSYGALGNQSVGLYKYIPTLSYDTKSLNYPLDGKNISLGYAINALPSANIKWETTVYTNFGLDFGFWNNKLELSAETYIKDTRDMLSSKNISLCTGFGSLVANDGKLRTTGYELQAIYHGKAGKFNYNLDLNLSHYKSVLKAMADPNYLYEYGPARTYVGGEIGELWVLRTAGIFQSQAEVDEWNRLHGHKDGKGNWIPLQPSAKSGDIRFIDQNDDGMLDSGDKLKVGSGNPKVVLGFNLNLAYQNFDLVGNFYGNFGVKRFNYTKRQLQRMDKNFNYGRAALHAWTPENPHTDIPRAVQGDPNKNNAISDRYIENGNFLKLNNLQFGYNFSSDLCRRLNISKCRVYIGGTNLCTITNYTGYDPAVGAEVGKMGADYGLYPLSRTYMAGIQFGF